MAQPPTIDRLLNLVPDAPDAVLTSLRAHPQLASQQDAHGYSLVHAATSYGHVGLLKALIQELNVLPNITDEDGETCLFNAETVEMANEVLALGVNIDVKNTDGQDGGREIGRRGRATTGCNILATSCWSVERGCFVDNPANHIWSSRYWRQWQ